MTVSSKIKLLAISEEPIVMEIANIFQNENEDEQIINQNELQLFLLLSNPGDYPFTDDTFNLIQQLLQEVVNSREHLYNLIIDLYNYQQHTNFVHADLDEMIDQLEYILEHFD